MVRELKKLAYELNIIEAIDIATAKDAPLTALTALDSHFTYTGKLDIESHSAFLELQTRIGEAEEAIKP